LITFEPVNRKPTTVKKVFLGTTHVGNFIFNSHDQTFVYESIGGNRTVLFQKDEFIAKLALIEKFKE